jgi:hypothetical protein
LQYLYYKLKRTSPHRGKDSITVPSSSLPQFKDSTHTFHESLPPPVGGILCKYFSRDGYCRQQHTCKDSHDIHLLLDLELKKRKVVQGSESGAVSAKRIRLEGGACNDSLGEEGEGVCGPDEGTLDTSLKKCAPLHDGKEVKVQRVVVGEVEVEEEDVEHVSKSRNQQCHSAGFDSFNTGYIFLIMKSLCNAEKLLGLKNRLYLGGKDIPLRLEKTNYM